jgi:hypothetical protein
MTRRQDYPALDNEHGAFCSCQACIDWRHDARIPEKHIEAQKQMNAMYNLRNDQYRGQYNFARRVPLWKGFVFWGFAFGLGVLCLFVCLPYAFRHIGADLVRLWHVFAGMVGR